MAPLLRNLRYSHACPAARLRARLPSAVARRSLRRVGCGAVQCTTRCRPLLGSATRLLSLQVGIPTR